MAKIQLIDTGYVDKARQTTARTQTVGSTTYNATVNSGTAIDLETAKLTYTVKSNVDNTSEPGVIAKGAIDANLVSSDSAEYSLSLTLTSTNATHQTLLKHLVGVHDDASYPGICRTEGIKALVISGTSDTKKTLVELTGSTSTEFHDNEITAGLPAILVYPNTLKVDDGAGSNVISVRIGFIEA